MVRTGSCWIIASLLAALALIAPISTISAVQPKCNPTRLDAEGPFYKANASERNSTGKGLVLSGTVRSASDCGPVAGARIEWWSADSAGQYNDDHRATQSANGGGRYRYEADFPGRYPGRPPHLHVRVTAPGHRPLVTQIYPKQGQTALNVDLVLVRE